MGSIPDRHIEFSVLRVVQRQFYKNAECFVGCEVLTAVDMKNYLFWEVTPYSPATSLTLVSCLAYSPTPKFVEIRSSETSIDFQKIYHVYPRR
jgi:hypothetical protein